MRIDKYLADNSIGTRKEIKGIIKAGRIYVNGVTAFDPGMHIVPGKDIITMDDRVIEYERFHYYMLNKPAGTVSSTREGASVTVVELGAKGNAAVHTVPLIPRHDMREIRGTYAELTLKKNWENTATDDYLRVILTDEEDVPDAMARLRTVYPNIMRLEYDNTRTRTASPVGEAENPEQKSEIELFMEFYEKQNGQPMSPEQRAFSEKIIESLKEEEA